MVLPILQRSRDINESQVIGAEGCLVIPTSSENIIQIRAKDHLALGVAQSVFARIHMSYINVGIVTGSR